MSSNDLPCSECNSQHHPMDFCPAETKTKKDKQLLPCPFCGKRTGFIGKGQKLKDGQWWYKPSAKCRICQYELEFESFEDALNWWNTRKYILRTN